MLSRRIADYRKVLPAFIGRYFPDMIGITVMCTTYTSALQMVEHLSEYFRGYIVLGGAQMSFEKEKALKDSERIDFGVVGEGEETLVELIERLERGKGLHDVQGLIYREDGEIKVSFRSEGETNAAALAERFGGGGHHGAAGCLIEGKLKDIMPFLDSLSYGENAPQGVHDTREAWRKEWRSSRWNRSKLK